MRVPARARVHALRATLLGAMALVVDTARASDWLQFGFDAAHSGANPDEMHLADRIGALAQVYAAPLPGDVDGAPVFLAAVNTVQGTRDLLFMTTVYGATLAIDAANGVPVWTQQTSGPAPVISSAPAIDPGRLYVYGAGLDGKVHKYNVADGSELVDAAWPETVTLKPAEEKLASALVFARAASGHAYLYATTSNFGYDLGDYQGHVTAIDLLDGSQAVFNALCSDVAAHLASAPATPSCAQAQAGVWGRPGVVYDASTDRIYASTGNGPFTAAAGGHDWGESVLALSPDLRASAGAPQSMPLDSYTPAEYAQLNADDDDLGVESPALLPAPANSLVGHLGVQIGKDGIVRLLDLDDLSGQGGPAHIGGELGLTTSLDYRGSLNTQPAVWTEPSTGVSWLIAVYKSSVHGFFAKANARGAPLLVEAWTIADYGGTSPVVADGVVFFVAGTNELVALDARSGVKLWSAPVNGVHWASPIVVNDTVYLTDNDAILRAYALPAFASADDSQPQPQAALQGKLPPRATPNYSPNFGSDSPAAAGE